MDTHFERVRFYLQRDRPAEAETALADWMRQEPDNPLALALLAELRIEQERYAEALPVAERALAGSPNEPFLLYMLARSQFLNKRLTAARATIARGLAADPTDEDFYLLLAHLDVYQERWADALVQVDRGLAIAPAQVQLLNLRAQILLKLNRKTEARQSLDYALAEAPGNSYSHANMGWAAVEHDQYDTAVAHFREALRLEPTNDFARNGLKEAIKGKNWLYRGVLKYFLWLGKLQERGRWAFVLGLYVFYRILLYLLEAVPALAPLLYPLVFVYVLFAFSSWIAVPISNLFLRLHPLGKHALSDDERTGSLVAGGLLVGSLVSLAAFYWLGYERLLYAGGFLGLLLIPAGGTFSTEPGGNARRYLAVYAAALVVLGLLGIVYIQTTVFVILFALGIFGFGWFANYAVSREAKEF